MLRWAFGFLIGSLLAASLVSVPQTVALGPTSHDLVAQQTVQYIDQERYSDLFRLLHDHPAARDGGAVFPDWGYATLLRNLSVVAHSPAFRQAYEDYIRESFPPPYDSAEAQQVAFLMGIIDHQVADARWHPYFLQEANRNDRTTEIVVELGVDIFTIQEQGQLMRWDEWYVPVETIVSVYHRLGHTEVTEEMIVAGMKVLRAAMVIERGLASIVYRRFLTTLPWAHANYMAYAPGGIADDARASAFENQNAWDSIQGAVVAAAVNPHAPAAERRTDTLYQLAHELLRFGKIAVPVERLADGGVLIGPPQISQELVDSLLRW